VAAQQGARRDAQRSGVRAVRRQRIGDAARALPARPRRGGSAMRWSPRTQPLQHGTGSSAGPWHPPGQMVELIAGTDFVRSCSASHRLLFSAFCSASSRRSPTAAATARPTPRCRERRSHRACPATLPRTERLGWEDRQRRTIYSSLGVLGRVRTSACRRPRGRDQRNGALSVSPDTMMAKSRRGMQRKVAGIGIRPWEGRPTPLTLCKLADDPWVEALAPRPLPDSCANPRSQ